MSADVLASKRFWFGVVGAGLGFLVLAFAGDPSVPSWLVKVVGAGNAMCGTAVALLQNSESKAKAKTEATREHKALP